MDNQFQKLAIDELLFLSLDLNIRLNESAPGFSNSRKESCDTTQKFVHVWGGRFALAFLCFVLVHCYG